MPVPLRALSRQGALDHIAARAASCHTPAVGLETEWFVVGPNRRLPVPFDVVQLAAAAGGPLPGGSRVTYEPGGQLELSGGTHPDAVTCQRASNRARASASTSTPPPRVTSGSAAYAPACVSGGRLVHCWRRGTQTGVEGRCPRATG